MKCDYILISTAADLMAAVPDKNYRLIDDIDLGGHMWAPLGTKDNPFSGFFDGDGHTVSDFEIDCEDACIGFFGAVSGEVCNLKLDSMRISGAVKDNCEVGAIAGLNSGDIANVHVKSGSVKLGASAGVLTLGTLVGTNDGFLRNCSSGVSLEVSCTGGELWCGGFVGETKSGLIETVENTGEIALSGESERIHAALYAARACNTVIRGNVFSSPMNTVNGELYQQQIAQTQDVTLDGNVWRDNRNDDRFLPPEKLAVRAKVENYMRAMGSVAWTPDKTLTHYCTCGGKVHKQIFPAGVTQYGIPYSHKGGSFERFNACFDENGELMPWLKTTGYDGWDMYIGNDCSLAAYWALSRVSDQISYEWTWTVFPDCNNGIIPCGDYDAYNSDDTGEIIERNTPDKIAEAIACLHIGDIILHAKNGSGHVRLVAKNAVIYRAPDGTIDFMRSYLTTHEQGDGLLYDNPKLGPSMSWLLDHKYNFRRLFKEEFIPLTTQVLQTGIIPEQHVTYSCDRTGYDAVNEGTISSNYRIISTNAKITETDGTEVFNQTIFTAVHAYDGHGNGEEAMKRISRLDGHTMPLGHQMRLKHEYNARVTIKDVDLSEFKPYFDTERLVPGKQYTYCVTALLSTGKSHTVVEFTFTA